MKGLRDLFPESYDQDFYELSPHQRGAFRQWSTLALDSSVLLNLYAYSKSTRESFLRILDALGDRVWIPHQAAYEYEKNRLGCIRGHIQVSRDLRERLVGASKDFKSGAEEAVTKVADEPQHPFVPIEGIHARLAAFAAEIAKELTSAESEFGLLLQDDTVRTKLGRITRGRIGEPFTQDQLDEIYDEGDRRYKRLQPPGYADRRQKKDVSQYGDLVVWRQLVARGKETHRPVLFVTDDLKEDWWHKEGGEHIRPRPELVAEMQAKAGVRFLLEDSAEFYPWAGRSVKRRPKQEAIREARRTTHVRPSLSYLEQILMANRQAIERALSAATAPTQRLMRETGMARDAAALLSSAYYTRQLEEFYRSFQAQDMLRKLLEIYPWFGRSSPPSGGTTGEHDGDEAASAESGEAES